MALFRWLEGRLVGREIGKGAGNHWMIWTPDARGPSKPTPRDEGRQDKTEMRGDELMIVEMPRSL
jgi:hypothetical protein